jgi:hypothetical protein
MSTANASVLLLPPPRVNVHHDVPGVFCGGRPSRVLQLCNFLLELLNPSNERLEAVAYYGGPEGVCVCVCVCVKEPGGLWDDRYTTTVSWI